MGYSRYVLFVASLPLKDDGCSRVQLGIDLMEFDIKGEDDFN